MQSRTAVILVASILVAASAATIVLSLRAAPAPAAAPSAVTTATAAVPPDPTDGASAASSLQLLASDPNSLVASGARQHVRTQAASAVPPGTTVAADPTSWAPDGLGGGTMIATLTPPGGAAVSYAVIMTRENGRWMVLATVPLGTAR